MKPRTLTLLIMAAAAIAAIIVYSQTTATGTVTITVSGYIAATPIDAASSITVDPASAQTTNLDNVPSWIAINASDDMIFNMSGTNVNLTIGYTYSITLPPSYPSGLRKPFIAVYANITNTSATTSLSSNAAFAVENYTVTLVPEQTYLANLYANGTSPTWIDLPEGFLNTFYGKSLNETQWYAYVYATNVTLPSIALLFDASSNKLEANTGTKLCLVVVDPDQSIANATQISGDEMVIVAPTCDLDVDSSNATAASTAPSRRDLAADADYTVPGGTATLNDTPAPAFYAYNQTDFMVLNFTVSYPSGAKAALYFRVKLSFTSAGINVTLEPVYPVPYNAVLGPIYASNSQPYLHAWPAIALPVGAPAGVYKATVYLELEQT